jgi:hypothetical protein
MRLPLLVSQRDWIKEWADNGLDVAFVETAVWQRARRKPGAVGVDPVNRLAHARGVPGRFNAKLKKINAEIFQRPVVNPTTALFEQARVATFLPYRDGLASGLASTPFSSEQAVHAYVRVLLVWAKSWIPLTVTTAEERARDARLQREFRFPVSVKLNHVGIPHIASEDLVALLEAHRRFEPRAHDLAELATAEVLLDQTRAAISMLRADESLHVLSAYNYVRSTANLHLGGALARLRISEEDLNELDSELHDLLFGGGLSALSREEREALFARRPFLAIWFRRMGGEDRD